VRAPTSCVKADEGDGGICFCSSGSSQKRNWNLTKKRGDGTNRNKKRKESPITNLKRAFALRGGAHATHATWRSRSTWRRRLPSHRRRLPPPPRRPPSRTSSSAAYGRGGWTTLQQRHFAVKHQVDDTRRVPATNQSHTPGVTTLRLYSSRAYGRQHQLTTAQPVWSM
jgi:hypothetical protein